MPGPLAEHIQYLKLPHRAKAYRAAIDAVMDDGAKVADLGCGVGVLGMFCLEAGAAHVWGIDQSGAIHLARETAERAGFTDRYTCIAASSFDTTLPQPVDLIICDHVGFFGFDYGITQMLADARARMLKPGGQIIPQSMSLQIAAVSSPKCRELAAEWSNHPVPATFHWLEEYNRNSRHAVDFEPEDLATEPAALGTIAFDEAAQDEYSFSAELTIAKDGLFDGIAGWFDCHLGAGVRMTNSPCAAESIKRSQAFLPPKHSFEVKSGVVVGVNVRFSADATLITWSIEPPGNGKKQTLSTFRSTIVDPAKLDAQSDMPVSLSPKGKARRFVLDHIDGGRNTSEIADLLGKAHPQLFPTRSALRDFVEKVIASNC